MSVGEFISVDVQGLKELEKALNDLSEELAQKILRAAARKEMRAMRDRVAANAPRGKEPLKKGRTIRLLEGITLTTTLKSDGVKGATVVARVGLRVNPKDRSVFYGKFIEFGTVKMAARPFMRPAFDSEKENVLRGFGEELGEQIEKAAGRR